MFLILLILCTAAVQVYAREINADAFAPELINNALDLIGRLENGSVDAGAIIEQNNAINEAIMALENKSMELGLKCPGKDLLRDQVLLNDMVMSAANNGTLDTLRQQLTSPSTDPGSRFGSTFSGGMWALIIGIPALVVIGVAAFVVVKKKKKATVTASPAPETSENPDEE